MYFAVSIFYLGYALPEIFHVLLGVNKRVFRQLQFKRNSILTQLTLLYHIKNKKSFSGGLNLKKGFTICERRDLNPHA